MARIVVADDDADIRDLVAFKLRQSDHDVVSVSDGAAAVLACAEAVPDLVVLDVMMPGMSGLEACRALRLEPALAQVQIILLTARAEDFEMAKGFDAGADDYVVKPFSPRELLTRVDTALRRAGAGRKNRGVE